LTGESGWLPTTVVASCSWSPNDLYSASVVRVPPPTYTLSPTATGVDDGGAGIGIIVSSRPVADSSTRRLEAKVSGTRATPLAIEVAPYEGPSSWYVHWTVPVSGSSARTAHVVFAGSS